jgi:hypothetical protein
MTRWCLAARHGVDSESRFPRSAGLLRRAVAVQAVRQMRIAVSPTPCPTTATLFIGFVTDRTPTPSHITRKVLPGWPNPTPAPSYPNCR